MEQLKTKSENITFNGFKIHTLNTSKLKIKENDDNDDLKDINLQSGVNTDLKELTSKMAFHSNLKLTKKRNKVSDLQERDANKRRLQSILGMKQGYRQQKSIIQNALLNIDSKPKNKIIFDDKTINGPIVRKTKFHNKTNNTYEENNKLSLFDEADDDNCSQYSFNVNEHFDGKKGKKLMELQTKFKNDERFKMDARFLEEDSNDESEDEQTLENRNESEIVLHDEKLKQLEILEEIIGKKISRKCINNVAEGADHSMIRFDPSHPDHAKFEVKEPPKEKSHKSKKRKISENQVENKMTEDIPIPEVSKETFYKVSSDLKETLNKGAEFSLTNLFNKEIEIEQQVTQTEEAPRKFKSTSVIKEKNPFRYDSSTEEEDDDKLPVVDNTPTVIARPSKLWSETLFFRNDDYRLQEGLDFIRRLETDDTGDFYKIRRNLKEIVRAKVRNNQKKNRPFKRKLGGKKRIRVKRALKR